MVKGLFYINKDYGIAVTFSFLRLKKTKSSFFGKIMNFENIDILVGMDGTIYLMKRNIDIFQKYRIDMTFSQYRTSLIAGYFNIISQQMQKKQTKKTLIEHYEIWVMYGYGCSLFEY